MNNGNPDCAPLFGDHVQNPGLMDKEFQKLGTPGGPIHFLNQSQCLRFRNWGCPGKSGGFNEVQQCLLCCRIKLKNGRGYGKARRLSKIQQHLLDGRIKFMNKDGKESESRSTRPELFIVLSRRWQRNFCLRKWTQQQDLEETNTRANQPALNFALDRTSGRTIHERSCKASEHKKNGPRYSSNLAGKVLSCSESLSKRPSDCT